MNMGPRSDTARDRAAAYRRLAALFRDGPCADSPADASFGAPTDARGERSLWAAGRRARVLAAVPPCARFFLERDALDGQETAVELAAVLSAGGFGPLQDGLPVDHLSTSLAYLARLSEREANAWEVGEPTAARRRRARAAVFIETQLYRWLPPLVVALDRVDPDALGSSAQEVVHRTLRHLARDPEPVPLPVRVRRPEPTDRQTLARYLSVPVHAGFVWTSADHPRSPWPTGEPEQTARVAAALRMGPAVVQPMLEAVAERTEALPCGAPWADRIFHSVDLVGAMTAS